MRKVVLLLGMLFSVVPQADSDPVTLSGTGVFDFVSTFPDQGLQPVLGFNVAQGEAFTFSIGFSSPTIILSGEDIAFYALGLGSFSVTVGPRSAMLSPMQVFGVVQIGNNASNSGDGLAIYGGLGSDYSFSLDGFDPSNQWLDSLAWPVNAAAALNAAPQAYMFFTRFECSPHECEDPVVASGSAEHMTQSPSAPVPEPTSLVLLASGLLAAVGARRWRQRKA